MSQEINTISPTIKDVATLITKIIDQSVANIDSETMGAVRKYARTSHSIYSTETKIDNSSKIVTSHIVGTLTDDSYSLSVSFALSTDLNTERTLDFFVVQNTNTADICVIITSCEKEGLKILFKSINKYPLVGIEKYLPNIIQSTILKLV